MSCPNPGPLNGDIHLDLVFLLHFFLPSMFTHFTFCTVIWDSSGETCYLNVKCYTSTAPENQNLWNWCCSTANLEKWFILLTVFQDFNGTLKILLMQVKQFHLGSLSELLDLKVHKLFLLVTQVELLFGAAVRLVSFCFHFCLQSL